MIGPSQKKKKKKIQTGRNYQQDKDACQFTDICVLFLPCIYLFPGGQPVQDYGQNFEIKKKKKIKI